MRRWTVPWLLAGLLTAACGRPATTDQAGSGDKAASGAKPINAAGSPSRPSQSTQVRSAFKETPCSVLPSTPANREELASFGRAKIPLIAGLVLVEAWQSKTGDREAITRVLSVDADAVRISYAGVGASDKPMTATRTICHNDLLNASTYVTQMGGHAPEIIHGATNFSLSRFLFKQLKAGKVFFRYEENIRMTGPDGYSARSFPGTLERVDEPTPVAVPVIVNDQPTELPAIHGRGELADTQAEIYVVDDLLNPVTLRYRMESLQFGTQMIKISYPVEKSQVEQQLAEKGRAEVYGIYFDFASAEIRAESTPALEQIAGIMNRNPSWRLNVEGHTDNIGGDSYNLDLSRRRAEAVKQALIDRYRIAGERLTPVGFGSSRPKQSNDTLAGRAVNRRVELVRQ